MTARFNRYQKLRFDWPASAVMRITLDNPGRLNSIDQRTHAELVDVWRDIDACADISAVIVTGAGKAFSAGGDLDMAADLASDFEKRCQGWKEARDLVYNMINCGKPIVSAMRDSWSDCWPTYRLQQKRPGLSTVTPGWASQPATMPRLSGRCCAAWQRQNTIYCCAKR